MYGLYNKNRIPPTCNNVGKETKWYKMKEKIITSRNCYLSSLEYSDLEFIKKWRNEQIDIIRQSKPLTSQNQEEYWERIANSTTEILFAILDLAGTFIGYCGFTNICSLSSRAELSFLLDTEIQEGSEKYLHIFEDVLRMLLEYGFERLNFNRLFSETHCFRERHLMVLEKVGFVKEGVLRNHVYKKNKFHDSIIHSVLREEYFGYQKNRSVQDGTLCQIMLINLPVIEPYFEGSDHPKNPPLGMAYLAATLEHETENFTVLDAYGSGGDKKFIKDGKTYLWRGYSVEEIVEIIKKICPGIVALSCNFTSQHYVLLEVIKAIKKFNSEIIVIVGGSHATYSSNLLLKKGADIIVLGEGDTTIKVVLCAIKNGSSLDGIEGIAYLKKGKIKVNPQVTLIKDIDSIPFPAWKYFPLEKYFEDQKRTTYGKKYSSFLPIMTSRGCPNNCSFCGTPAMWKRRYRTRTVENVLEEIKILCKNYPIKHLQILDDNFLANKIRAKEILKRFATNFKGISLDFANHLEIDLLDEEFIGLAGNVCKELSFGVESGSQRILDIVRKPLNLNKNLPIFSKINDAGLELHAHFIIGFPEETEEDLMETYRVAKMLKEMYDAYVEFYIFCPLPGTEIFDKLNYTLDDTFLNFSFSLGPSIPVNKNISLEKLQEYRRTFWEEINVGILQKNNKNERSFKNIKAIIFDFDDALVDEEHWIQSRWEETIIFAEQTLMLHNFGNYFWDIYHKKGPKYKHHVNDVLTWLNQSHDLVKTIVDNFLAQKVDEKLLPGVKECLQFLQGKFKLGIITNGKNNAQIERIKQVGIYDYFDSIVCAYENPKPHEQSYLDCAAQLGVLPKDCVYVSHDIDTDLQGAKNAGLSTILLDFHNINNSADARNNPCQEIVDLKVNSYYDLIKHFKNESQQNNLIEKVKEVYTMEKKGILIVGAGLLQIAAVQKAKELGYYVYITDMNTQSEAAKMADEVFAISTKDIGAHVQLAKRLKAENKIVAVYTQGCDVEYTVAMAARAAGLPGIDPEAALNCNDKVKMRTVLNEKNVDYVKFASAKTNEEVIDAVRRVGFPCIIKPLDNSASRGVKVLHEGITDQEIIAAFNDAINFCFMRKEVIIEEFFTGDEYSVDTVMYKGKLFPAGVSDRQFRPVKEYSVQVGSLTPSLLPEKMQADMYTLMEKAALALGVDNGAFKGDLIIINGKPRIIEVTARTSGGFDSQYRKPYSFGIDIIKATIDIAAGKEMDPCDLVSKWMKWSKTTSVFPEPGIIKNIKGLEELEKMSGVRNIFHSMKVGDEVKDYRNCASRINHIVIVADTFDELNKLEDKVHATLQIETEPICNVHQ
ncbi:hypothetical protein COV17_00215 [Candidatus Woesearchaeota archaeon CG10_big_fil_rev_8_21_14_0_10_36_11]|nr:MAG: hypothetical protein COV17_00215 [Candidatus Woesearchaeota archaeon CG10_big_fil_rev_8_21_14_0_10_36_11]